MALVDPEQTVTVPKHVTASTGFDIFRHAFEAYLHPGASPMTDMLALEAIRLVAENLPAAAEQAGEHLDDFMKRIGMWLSLKGLGVSEEEVVLIADHSQVLPDYKNNPRVAPRDEILEMLKASYQR